MEQVAAVIRTRTGAHIATFSCDVRDPARMNGLAEFAVHTFGALDIRVNNAGIGFLMQPLLEVTAPEWRAVIDVNLTGCFNGIQAAARHHGE